MHDLDRPGPRGSHLGAVRRILGKQTFCNGNTETWRPVVGGDSIIGRHFRSFRSRHLRIVPWEADPDGPHMLRFTRARDLDRWIASLPPVSTTRTTYDIEEKAG